MTFPFGQTLVIVRPGEPTFRGDPGTPEADRPVAGCAVWPGDTIELTDARDSVVADLTTTWPVGTDILSTDLVRDPGYPGALDRYCAVIGDPNRYHSPLTGTEVLEVRLQRVRG